jgi:hypothetical protein
MSYVGRLLEIIHTDKTTDEQAVCEAAFRSILDGKPIDQAGLVAATGFGAESVRTLLRGLTERGLTVLEPKGGRVVGSWGLSLAPTGHRLRIRKRDLFAWCALDAVGIPAGLAEDADIASTCHQCRSEIYLEMTAGHVTLANSSTVWLWLSPCQVGRSVVGFT